MSLPSGVAVDASGNVYVADTDNNRTQKFDSSGSFLLTWGRDVIDGPTTDFEICSMASQCKIGLAGAFGGEQNQPLGVATDSAGKVFVADTVNNRIQKFGSDGSFDLAWGKGVDGI